MKDYIKEIASRLNQNEAVIFYTVGSRTFGCARELKARYGLRATAVCDGDGEKQGNTYQGLDGLVVLSPETAAAEYPGAYWFIPSLDYRFQIIAYLTKSLNISSNHIINYTPVHKIKSCRFIQKTLIYDRTDDLRFCWRTPCPSSSRDGINGGDLYKLRRDLIEPIQTERAVANPSCDHCPQSYEDFYPVESRVWSINYFCNSAWPQRPFGSWTNPGRVDRRPQTGNF